MSLALHLKGEVFRPWMKIPNISVPLHQILKNSVIDSTMVTFTEKWKGRHVLPKILQVLHLAFEEWGVDSNEFDTFLYDTPLSVKHYCLLTHRGLSDAIQWG
jgi:hypothetical protein